MASSTTTQEYRKRQNLPGYMEANQTGTSLSSNNPFRMSIISSESPPLVPLEEVWNIGSSSNGATDSERSGSGPYIAANHRQQSFSDYDLSSSGSVFKQAEVVGSRPIGIGQRRVVSRNPSHRKSTNPFVDFDEQSSYRTFSQSLEDVTYRPNVREKELEAERERLPSYQESSDRNFSSSTNKSDKSSGSNYNSHERNIPRRPSSRTKPFELLEKPSLRERRANSDSSVMSTREREREKERQGDRDHHHKSSRTHRSSHDRHDRHDKHGDKHRHRTKDHHKKKDGEPIEGIDVIDKLDVSGFYAPGSFHHDGPFDACNPHRNKNTKKAPVAAFPADGANNSLRNAVGNRDSSVENRIMGRTTTEAYTDFSSWGALKKNKSNAAGDSFDASAKAEPVHGDTTMGLGSSTFLDGAPASQAAIKESFNDANGAGGLGRKKSLVQRLRGNSHSNGAAPPQRPAPIPRNLSPPGTGNYEPISRSSSNPEPSSPAFKNMPRVTLQDPPASEYTGSSSTGYDKVYEVSPSATPKENGFMRRVKSLKVGGRRKS